MASKSQSERKDESPKTSQDKTTGETSKKPSSKPKETKKKTEEKASNLAKQSKADLKQSGSIEIPNEDIPDEEFEFDFLDFDEEERNYQINQLIGRIDKRIAELEEEERKEKAQMEKKEKAGVEETIQKPVAKEDVRCSIVFKKIVSFEKTASIIGACLGITTETGNIVLQRAMSKGHHTINGIPSDKAAKMIDMFKEIGTIATMVNKAA